MKTRLNLATAPLENNRRFVVGALLAAVVVLTVFVVLSRQTYRGWRENRETRERAAGLQSELKEYRNLRRELEEFFKKPENKRVLERAAFLNGLIEQRSFPWTQIFMDLERRLPVGVRVISISPKMEEGRVQLKLTIGAISDEAKLRFLRTLEEAPEFSSVQVTSESRPPHGQEEDQVRLELVAWYQASFADTGALRPAPPGSGPARKQTSR